MFCSEILQKPWTHKWNDLSLWRNTAFTVRSFPPPAAAKERNFLSTLKLDLSFEGLCFKLRLESCVSGSFFFFPHKCLLKQVGWSFQNSKVSIKFLFRFSIYSLFSPLELEMLLVSYSLTNSNYRLHSKNVNIDLN